MNNYEQQTALHFPVQPCALKMIHTKCDWIFNKMILWVTVESHTPGQTSWVWNYCSVDQTLLLSVTSHFLNNIPGCNNAKSEYDNLVSFLKSSSAIMILKLNIQNITKMKISYQFCISVIFMLM